MDNKDIVHLIRIRRFVYDLFRGTFGQEPSQGYLDTILQVDFVTNFPFALESELIQNGIRLIDDYLKQHDVTNDAIYDQLHWDYTRLFIGPYKLPAPPWESSYQSEERLVFQESTLRVRMEYAKYGYRPINFQSEPDDHLGLELDYMYQLAGLTEDLLYDDRDQYTQIIRDSKLFLENHLLNWVPLLAQDIVKSAHTDFYKGMAMILHGYLQLDLDALKELIHIEETITLEGNLFESNPKGKELYYEQYGTGTERI